MMMIDILFIVIWLGTCTDTQYKNDKCTEDEVVVLTTNGGMDYCLKLTEQVLSGDGADYAYCKYKGE
tara:strand:- start:360 stop:560 length:201 start_codon:yes stop_codon:yes gene_type:complete